MAVKSHSKLDEAMLAVLRDQVSNLGSVAAVAAKLGYSRPAISGALNGSYTGGTDRLRSRIVEVFLDAILCPHLQAPIEPAECRWWRTRPCPTSRASDVRHWAACKTCIFNPDRKEPTL